MVMSMRFPEGKDKVVTLSYDDGTLSDKKLISIMQKNGIKGTFNLNSARVLSEDAVLEEPENLLRLMKASELKESYPFEVCEVAVHFKTHPFPSPMPINAVTQEIMTDRTNLEKMFKTIVRGCAYPYGDYNDTTVESLKASGIVYSRTCNSTHDFELPKNWLLLDPTCHNCEPCFGELVDKFLNLKVGDGYMPKMFYLWGHSMEFVHFKNWEVFEQFCEKVGGRDDIWYATNIEIYDYCMAYRQLLFSNDCEMVHNPTALDIWINFNGRKMKIPSGKTVLL